MSLTRRRFVQGLAVALFSANTLLGMRRAAPVVTGLELPDPVATLSDIIYMIDPVDGPFRMWSHERWGEPWVGAGWRRVRHEIEEEYG